MDAVDLAILREMMSPRVLLFGSLNPRLSGQAMAKRLKLDPTTVRTRIHHWEASGFLTRFEIIPNPRLFGASVYAGAIHVPELRRREGVLEGVEALDGALHSMEHVGGWVGLGMAVEHPSVVERRAALLARMQGVVEVQPFFEVDLAGPTKEPTPLDWRILAALRASPKARMRDLAAEVGVSPNTFQARYAALVRHRVVWSLPELDFTRFTGGGVMRLLLTVEAAASPQRIGDALDRAFSQPLSLQEPTGLARDGVRVLDLLLHLPAVAAADDILAFAGGLPGVREAEALYPRKHRVHPHWVAERLAERAKAAEPPSRGSRARGRGR